MTACAYTTVLPTDQNVVDSNTKALPVAKAWLDSLSASIAAKDSTAAAALFLEDSFWRDILALTPDFRTVKGRAGIKAFLDDNLSRAELGSFSLATGPYQEPSLGESIPTLKLVQFCFDFETKIGKGFGVCRLVPMQNGDQWKSYTMYTTLVALKGFPEKIGALRNTKPYYDGNWVESRRREEEFLDGDPIVLVVGAGHSGLEIAARLKNLGVSTLVVEKQPRIGDTWRKRYKTLCLHDPICFMQTPYMPFPSSWPTYTPSPKMANWLEHYAESLELNVWTSATAERAVWNERAKTWEVKVLREGEAPRVLNVRHLVFATGLVGGAQIPDLQGKDLFKGDICHSSSYTSGTGCAGRKAVVIGAGVSGHDIALDLYNHGADVTLNQRSSTCIVSAAGFRSFVEGLYNEVLPIDLADHLDASFAFPVAAAIHKILIAQNSKTCDKELLDGLHSVGFRTNLGLDDSGLYSLVLERGGGFYFDMGASQLIADGRIKLKAASQFERLTEKGVMFSDGSELEADLVVFSTGYKSAMEYASGIIGHEVANKVGRLWGVDKEGELNGCWRKTAQPGLWFALGNLAISRYYSIHMALQIKAIEEGLMKL